MIDESIKLPGLWDDVVLSPVLLLKKGAERRRLLRNIIVEALRAVAPQRPTARNLQKLCRIRRKTFLPLLKEMLERGIVVRHGSGTKCDPYKYQLDYSNRS